MDITDHEDVSPEGLTITLDPIPSAPRYHDEVRRITNLVRGSFIESYNHMLTEFFTRYYTSETGEQAARKIYETFKNIALNAGRNDIDVQLFSHSWRQPSVIARIRGNGQKKNEIIVISAHEDSINLGGSIYRAPGADDDASGVSNVLEAFRAIVTSGFKPDRTIEFHTYAAEEVGLRGSQDIANHYRTNNIPVHAQLQLDMTMYTKTPQYMAIMTDYVDSSLTEFLKQLVQTYTTKSVVLSRCGYGCSDHASWNRAGYRASFPFETTFDQDNPYIHTSNDIFDHLSVEHGIEFTKLAIAFAVELSHE